MDKSILRLRKEFINQCENGIWDKNHWDDYYNNNLFDFSIKKQKIRVKNIPNSDISISELGISKFKMYILFLKIKKSVKNSENIKRKVIVKNISEDFLKKNKDIFRNSQMDDILK